MARIDDVPITWSTPVIHEWPEHARLSEPDGIETVRVVPSIEEMPAPFRDPPPPIIDDGARLDTPEARRSRNLGDLAEWTLKAVTTARRARECGQSFGYHSEVLDALSEMIEWGSKALDLIGLYEDG